MVADVSRSKGLEPSFYLLRTILIYVFAILLFIGKLFSGPISELSHLKPLAALTILYAKV